MRSLGGGWVIAVDVSLDRDLEMREAALPSPWKVLRNWGAEVEEVDVVDDEE